MRSTTQHNNNIHNQNDSTFNQNITRESIMDDDSGGVAGPVQPWENRFDHIFEPQ